MPVHAEDLLQDTFIEIMRNIGQFRGEAPIGAWVRQVAVSKALMFLRSSWQRQGRSLDDDWEETTPGVQPARESHDEVIDLDSALARLPDTARAVVWLHDVEGFTHREIGQFMGKSESFSKSQLSRAYQRLRPFLRGAAAEGTPVAQSQPEGPGMGVRPVPAPDWGRPGSRSGRPR